MRAKAAECAFRQDEMQPAARPAQVRNRATPDLPQAVPSAASAASKRAPGTAASLSPAAARRSTAQPLPGQHGQRGRVAGPRMIATSTTDSDHASTASITARGLARSPEGSAS